jgi:hypothetical protein
MFMTQDEQTAFLDAYDNNVADASREQAAAFLSRYVAGEDIDYGSDYTSIMDALGMWHAAVMFTLIRNRK